MAIFSCTRVRRATLALMLMGLMWCRGPDAASAEGTPPPPTDAVPESAAPSEQPVEPAVPAPSVAPAVVEPPPQEAVDPHVVLSGNIWRMKPGFVFLRTPIGLMTLTCKTCLRDLRGTPTVTLYLHGNQGAVEIVPRGSSTPTHRYLWGPMTYAAPDKKEVLFWTPDGVQSFPADGVTSKLSSVPHGHAVTVEVREAGKILGVHDLQFDLQVSQVPTHASNLDMKITGSVSKIKNGYVHVQTRIGMLPITTKSGLCQGKDRCRAKVGHELTLWIHDTAVAIDLHQAGSRAPVGRVLTGKLAYAGPDKNTLVLWTPEGEQSFPIERAKGALSSLKEGSPVTVDLDAEGAVSDIRKGS